MGTTNTVCLFEAAIRKFPHATGCYIFGSVFSMTSLYRTIQEWVFHILASVWLWQIMYQFGHYDIAKSDEESFKLNPVQIWTL